MTTRESILAVFEDRKSSSLAPSRICDDLRAKGHRVPSGTVAMLDFFESNGFKTVQDPSRKYSHLVILA